MDIITQRFVSVIFIGGTKNELERQLEKRALHCIELYASRWH